MTLAHLPNRAVLAVTGEDRVAFLQGLVSNDVALAAPGRAVWAALLTPQGKWLADFFVLSDGERLLLDCEAAQAPDLARRLLRYRLRARAAVDPAPLAVHAAWNEPPPEGATTAPDPRLPDAGWRVLAPSPLAPPDNGDWDTHRLRLGLPDGSRDMEPEKSVLLEAGFDELSGVSWTKGCYMGQELTARTKYRGLVKRRLVAVTVDGPLPAPGTPIFNGDLECGTIRSGRQADGQTNGKGRALATLRLDALAAARLTCADATLTPAPSPWLTTTVQPAS